MYGCGKGRCVRETGPDEAARRLVELWSRCGGAERRFLPREGGVAEQDAAEVYWLESIDVMVREAKNQR